jgi:hypothetical protein
MQRLPFTALTAALLLAASAAYAFEIQPLPTNPDGSAKFSDPDQVTQNMANHLAGESSSDGMTLFGGRMSIQGSGGWNAYGMSNADRDRFLGGPDAIGNAYVAPR